MIFPINKKKMVDVLNMAVMVKWNLKCMCLKVHYVKSTTWMPLPYFPRSKRVFEGTVAVRCL